MADAPIDSNSRQGLIAASSADGKTPIRVYADPSTHRLLVTATGGVVGPATSTDGAVALWDGTTGETLKDSTVTVSGTGVLAVNSSITAYAVGTVYSLTNTAALLDFGTTDPSITVNVAGTYLIFARVRYDYTGATFAAVRTITTKIRRTNNTAADVANSSCGFEVAIQTLISDTAVILDLPPVIYTTSNTNDILQLWGSIDTVPSAGSVDAVEASLVAIRLS